MTSTKNKSAAEPTTGDDEQELILKQVLELLSNDGFRGSLYKHDVEQRFPGALLGQVLSSDSTTKSIRVDLDAKHTKQAIDIYTRGKVDLTELYQQEVLQPLHYLMLDKNHIADAQAKLFLQHIIPDFVNCSQSMRNELAKNMVKCTEILNEAHNREVLVEQMGGSLGFLEVLIQSGVKLTHYGWECKPCGSDYHFMTVMTFDVLIKSEFAEEKGDKIIEPLKISHVRGCEEPISEFTIAEEACGSYPENEEDGTELTVDVDAVRDVLHLPLSIKDSQIRLDLERLSDIVGRITDDRTVAKKFKIKTQSHDEVNDYGDDNDDEEEHQHEFVSEEEENEQDSNEESHNDDPSEEDAQEDEPQGEEDESDGEQSEEHFVPGESGSESGSSDPE
jgi:hypothetical protein